MRCEGWGDSWQLPPHIHSASQRLGVYLIVLHLHPLLITVEDVVLHLPLAVHLLPRHHVLARVLEAPWLGGLPLDALALGEVIAQMIGAGLVGDVRGACDRDLAGLEAEDEVRGLEEADPGLADRRATAGTRRAGGQEVGILGVNVRNGCRVLRRNSLNPLLAQVSND